MKGKNDFLNQLDLPGETLPGQVLVEIAGENRVLIECHRGICEYSPERIGVCVRYGIVEICGRELQLQCMTKNQLIICGRIDDVHLKRREQK